MSKVKIFFKALFKSAPKKTKTEAKDQINTSKEQFDLRGAFNLRPLDSGNKVRKEEFMLRLLALIVGGLFSTVIILALALKTLIPLHKVEPMFLSVASQDKQIYRVEPLDKTTKAFRVVTESLIYKYIEDRESIDWQTDNERYQYIQWMSGDTVKQEYSDEFSKSNEKEDAPWVRSRAFNLSRGVKILGIDFLSDNKLQADFNLFEYRRGTGQIVTKATMRATITIEYDPERVTAKDKYMNPLGLKVTDYSLATRDLKEFIVLRKNKNAQN